MQDEVCHSLGYARLLVGWLPQWTVNLHKRNAQLIDCIKILLCRSGFNISVLCRTWLNVMAPVRQEILQKFEEKSYKLFGSKMRQIYFEKNQLFPN